METFDSALDKFKEIIRKYPDISANQYDVLKIDGKPGRRTLEVKYKCSWLKLLELIGHRKDTARISIDKDSQGIKKEYSNDSGFIETTSIKIKTLKQALEIAKVNLKKWMVDRYIINSWTVTMKIQHEKGDDTSKTVTNYQVKVWLKPKIIGPLEEAIKALIKEIPKLEIPKQFVRQIKKADYAVEIALYDAHIGKLAWGAETMQGDQNTKIQADLYVKSAEETLNFTTNFPIEKIYFIIGQDFLHIENYEAQTPIGRNNLEADSRLPKVYLEGKKALLKALYLCREVAPVECLWVPGNHDMHISFYLSEVVKEHFSNDKFLTVDNTPPWRKARLWGNLLVGYTHDSSIRTTNIVNMLPQFWPELWAKSKFREWHVGHKHKKDEIKYKPTQTVGGVIIRQIPALSTIDAWHYQHAFVDAVPAGESFIWSKKNGICGHFTAYVDH